MHRKVMIACKCPWEWHMRIQSYARTTKDFIAWMFNSFVANCRWWRFVPIDGYFQTGVIPLMLGFWHHSSGERWYNNSSPAAWTLEEAAWCIPPWEAPTLSLNIDLPQYRNIDLPQYGSLNYKRWRMCKWKRWRRKAENNTRSPTVQSGITN